MGKELREELMLKLKSALELDRNMVGVRFIYSKDDFESCQVQPILHHLPYCMMVKSASKGNNIKAKPENIGCFAAARVLGMTEVSETYKSGEDYMGFGMFHDRNASKKVCDNISICPEKPYGIELGPVEKMEKDPHVVILVTVPYNVMRLVHGYNYYNGTYSNYKMGGLQAICAEATVYPFISGEINTTMMCAGTRYLNQWERSEMAVSISYDKLENTIDGLIRTINPLERDGDKRRIETKFKETGLPDLELNYGQNYDTNYYELGKNKKR